MQTPAKLNVIEALGDLYSATTWQIARYVRGHEPSESEIRSTNNSLQLLLDDAKNKYIIRKRFPPKYIYGLTDSGAELARSRGVEGARQFIGRDLEHEHILTNVIIAYREFCKAHGFTLKVERLPIDHSKIINPDALFTIETAAGKYVIPIEVERQTFNESYLKKALKYRSVFNTDEASKLFRVPKFRVHFFVETRRKREFILEKFSADYAYRMFWFTTFDDILNLNEPIFRTPKDYQTVSYSLVDMLNPPPSTSFKNRP